MNPATEKRFGIWHSGLTGRYYAGWAKRRKGTTVEQDLWEASGVKHDVTGDVEAILRASVKERDR